MDRKVWSNDQNEADNRVRLENVHGSGASQDPFGPLVYFVVQVVMLRFTVVMMFRS